MSDSEPVKRLPDEVIGKIAPASLGSPQAALADENVNKATMGQIFAIITRLVRRSKTDAVTGEISQLEGMGGQVIAIPANQTAARKLSSTLYLPEGLCGPILDQLKQAEKDKKDVTVQIALELFVQRAKNPAGYSWGARKMIEEPVDLDDPMQKFIAAVTNKTLALPVPDKEQMGDEPATEKVKASR